MVEKMFYNRLKREQRQVERQTCFRVEGDGTFPKTFGFISHGWDWDSKLGRWLDEASVHHLPVHQSDLLTASSVSSWGASWLGTERLSAICLGVEQKSGWSEVKPCCPLRKDVSAVFLSSFYVKTPSSSDKSVTTAASILLAVSQCLVGI